MNDGADTKNQDTVFVGGSKFAAKRPTERVRVARFSLDLLIQMFTTDAKVRYKVSDGLPSDARVIRAWIDGQCGDICILVESEEFDEVPRGGFVPECIVMATTYNWAAPGEEAGVRGG